MPFWLSNLRERSLPVRTAALAAAMTGVFLAAAPVVWRCGGAAGVAWAAVAGAACLAGSALALAAGEPFRSTRRALTGMLLGMTLRMGVPAAVAAAVFFGAKGAAGAGFLYCLAAFFEVALAIEVFLWLPPAPASQTRSVVTRENGKGGARESRTRNAS